MGSPGLHLNWNSSQMPPSSSGIMVEFLVPWNITSVLSFVMLGRANRICHILRKTMLNINDCNEIKRFIWYKVFLQQDDDCFNHFFKSHLMVCLQSVYSLGPTVPNTMTTIHIAKIQISKYTRAFLCLDWQYFLWHGLRATTVDYV